MATPNYEEDPKKTQEQIAAEAAAKAAQADKVQADIAAKAAAMSENKVNDTLVLDPAKAGAAAADPARQNIEKIYDAAKFDVVQNLLDQRNEQIKQKQNAADEQKSNVATSRFGAAAQAAAALVNLIGTTQGAANQQWQSPVAGWQSRIDQIMKEREAKIESYNTTMQALKDKKSALDLAKSEALTKYDQNKVTQQIAASNAAMGNYFKTQNLVAKQVDTQQKIASGIANTRQKLIASYMKEMGKAPSNEWVNEQIKLSYPDYFKEDRGSNNETTGGMADSVFGKKE